MAQGGSASPKEGKEMLKDVERHMDLFESLN